jgi:hypothetical protein
MLKDVLASKQIESNPEPVRKTNRGLEGEMPNMYIQAMEVNGNQPSIANANISETTRTVILTEPMGNAGNKYGKSCARESVQNFV